jgi:uncharacterized protein YbjT (DUF2867 family)
MRILLLGATGRTGQLLLKKSLEDKHEVTAIVRDPSKLKGMDAKLIQGTPYDLDTVKSAIKNCEAVICALNISRTSDNPWAKLRAPKDLISRSIENALTAMRENGIKRVITLSALGAGDSKKKMPFIFNFLISITNLKYAYLDHTRQEEMIAQSGLEWTVVRLPMLTDKKGEFEIRVNKNDDVKLNKDINRESVARFVLSILNKNDYYKKIVAISNK